MKDFVYVLQLNQKHRIKDNFLKESVQQILTAHHSYLEQLTNDGIVIAAGRTDYTIENEDTFGIVLFKAESEEIAKEIIQNDPAVLNHIMTAKLHPFRLTLRSEFKI